MAETVSVTVEDGWAVFHDGEHRVGGTTLEVPVALADHWIERGWAGPTDKPRVRRQRRQ